MKIGVFSDVHDHLDNLRSAIGAFNSHRCDLVIFAGDLVSTIAIPPLRKLQCPFVGCYGDNEGNRVGIQSGMSIVGTMADPPFGFRTADGTRIVITHQRALLAGNCEGCDVLIYGHTHRASVEYDRFGRLLLNPGEAGGWTYGQPTVAIVETKPLRVELVSLLQARESRNWPFSP